MKELVKLAKSCIYAYFELKQRPRLVWFVKNEFELLGLDFQVLCYWFTSKKISRYFPIGYIKKDFPCTESQKTHFLENKYKLLKKLQNPFYSLPSVSYDFSRKPNNLYILISKKTWNASKEKRKKKGLLTYYLCEIYWKPKWNLEQTSYKTCKKYHHQTSSLCQISITDLVPWNLSC